MNKYLISTALLFTLIFFSPINAGLNLAGAESGILAQGVFINESNDFVINNGYIGKKTTGIFEGSIRGKQMLLLDGFYRNDGSTSRITGGGLTIFEEPLSDEVIQPVDNVIEFEGNLFPNLTNQNPDVLGTLTIIPGFPCNLGPGELQYNIAIPSSIDSGGKFAFISGNPQLFTNNSITLEDSFTGLTLSFQSNLNTNVYFNNGTIALQDDLRLGDDAKFFGTGQVVFNNRTLTLGGGTNIWDNTMLWNSAFDLQLNSLTKLNGTWAFIGDGQINGNGNVLDISDGGKIIVLGNSTLRLTSVKLKGLGTGSILLADDAQLRLSDTEIILDLERTSTERNPEFLFNNGGIIVDGPTNIITKNNVLRFDQNGSLTVDRVPLSYDPLDTIDNFNIRPLRIEDPNKKFINIINNGVIRRIRQEPISFVDYSSDTGLKRYAVIFPERPMRIFPESIDGELNFDVTVDGKTHFLGFTRSDEPLLFVSDGVHVRFEDIVMRDYSPMHLSRGVDSEVVFGNKTTVRTARDEILNDTWFFEGDTILKCGGNILELGEDGEIVLQGENSTLLIQGAIIKGISGNKIRCTDPSSKIIMKNVIWIQDGEFTFDTGNIEVLTTWSLIGPEIFNYITDGTLTILKDATMSTARGVTFNYEPMNQRNDLIKFENSSSTFVIEDSLLIAPAPGLQLTKGRLQVIGRNFLNNPNATSESQGILLGNGIEADNLTVDKPSSATLEILTGFLEDLNV